MGCDTCSVVVSANIQCTIHMAIIKAGLTEVQTLSIWMILISSVIIEWNGE